MTFDGYGTLSAEMRAARRGVLLVEVTPGYKLDIGKDFEAVLQVRADNATAADEGEPSFVIVDLSACPILVSGIDE